MDLTDNTDLFKTVFDSASNGITVLQPMRNEKGITEDFSILLLNAYTLNWIGNIDYKGKRYADVFPITTAAGIVKKFIEVAETGLTAIFEYGYEVDDIKYWFNFTVVRHADLLVVTTKDITESKQTEIALNEALNKAQKQKRLYDSITNNTPDLVYVFDLSYNFTYANKALLNMWGKSAKDAIGRGLRENGYEEWHAQMHEREIDKIVATKKSIRGTVSFPHAELGTRIYDYILVPVLNEEGEVEAIAGTTRDVTEQIEAQKKISESESRFRNMIEQAPVAIGLTRGNDFIFESINPPMLKLIGKNHKDEVMGKPLLEVLPELKNQNVHEILQNVLQSGQPFHGSDVLAELWTDGDLKNRYFNISYTYISDADATPFVLHMAVEVTEQVLARRKIEESEARLKSVIDQTPAPTLVLMGDDLVIEQINNSMLELIGRGEEIIGTPLIAVLPELEGQYIWEQVLRVYNEGIPFDQTEVPVTHKRAGKVQDFYYNLAYRPLIEGGKIIGMIQAAIDVTEQVVARKKLEESENRFRALVNASSDVIYSLNADWTIMNPLDGRGFLSDAHEPVEGWMEINVHPADMELVKKRIADVIKNKSVFELEHRVIRADGGTGWTFSRAIPILDHDGNIFEWFGAASDVSDRKKAEEALKKSENSYKILSESLEQQVNERTSELKRSNEDLQQFAHVASHDLKEPIRKIKTFTGRLEEHLNGELDEFAKRFIERIHVATDRMFTMIDGVLAYSKINADLQEPQLVDLNEVIKNIETDLEVALQKTGGKIQYHDLPQLEGASVLLYQLFYNLINNSIKFSKEDTPPQINISSKTTTENQRTFTVITLTDNGIGFAAEQAERIFDTFTRLNSKDKYEGTGLGLALCKKIVERHGGSISAASSLGDGATFTIILPLSQKENSI